MSLRYAGSGNPEAHVSGLSLGAATGMWLAAKCPRIKWAVDAVASDDIAKK
ncbi:MAG: hypothetical protein M3P99_01595 [Pseudomonadota bacterium]|nr:hypothetical protein [Pseudomonadota bacterium]